jgi:hypothetical protein
MSADGAASTPGLHCIVVSLVGGKEGLCLLFLQKSPRQRRQAGQLLTETLVEPSR